MELKICSEKHDSIVYHGILDKCPLCRINEWTNHLHDFIEKNNHVDEWKKYIAEKNL